MKILCVEPGSPADRAGLVSGDSILRIDSFPVQDALDLMVNTGTEKLYLTLEKDGKQKDIVLNMRPDEDFGIKVEDFRWQSCGNNCIFCFVDQLPDGLRESLYFKDEDYRLSFLTGSYVTLTRTDFSDIERIIRLRLSPLRVSVHTSDNAVRKELLGIRRDDWLFDKLERLAEGGITVHTQIVVCPGINDGKVLEKTIKDLAELRPSVESVAVVPVGITNHRRSLPKITSVDSDIAHGILDIVNRLHNKYIKESGNGFVYAADELFLRAGLDIPDLLYYDDFPQWEDGVGMIRTLIDDIRDLWKQVKKKLRKPICINIITGKSSAPIIKDIIKHNPLEKLDLHVIEVSNRLFGSTVTASGLLCGSDILFALEGHSNEEIYLLPPNVLNSDGVLLDDMIVDELREKSGLDIRTSDYSLKDTILNCLN